MIQMDRGRLIGRKLYFQLISEMEVGSLTQREGERLRGRGERQEE